MQTDVRAVLAGQVPPYATARFARDGEKTRTEPMKVGPSFSQNLPIPQQASAAQAPRWEKSRRSSRAPWILGASVVLVTLAAGAAVWWLQEPDFAGRRGSNGVNHATATREKGAHLATPSVPPKSVAPVAGPTPLPPVGVATEPSRTKAASLARVAPSAQPATPARSGVPSASVPLPEPHAPDTELKSVPPLTERLPTSSSAQPSLATAAEAVASSTVPITSASVELPKDANEPKRRRGPKRRDRQP